MSLKPIWILTHPRTGSYYLCGLLNSTGLFGECPFAEHRNPNQKKNWKGVPKYNKFHWQWVEPKNLISTQEFQQITQQLPGLVYVNLYREDKAAQTVSLLFSRASKKWRSHKADGFEDFYMPFDIEAMVQCYKEMQLWQKLKNEFLRDKEHITIEHSQVVDNPVGTVKSILKFANYPIRSPHPDKVRDQKMNNKHKTDYVERLRNLIENKELD